MFVTRRLPGKTVGMATAGISKATLVGSDIPGSEESDQDVTIPKPLLTGKWYPTFLRRRV